MFTVVNRILLPQNVYFVTPGIFKYVTLHGTGDQVKNFEMGRIILNYPGGPV